MTKYGGAGGPGRGGHATFPNMGPQQSASEGGGLHHDLVPVDGRLLFA